MTLATIKVGHQTFQIAGPPELVLWMQALQRTSGTPEAKNTAYNNKIRDYFVFCSVTNEHVPLSELKYWNVDTQQTFKNAESALTRYSA